MTSFKISKFKAGLVLIQMAYFFLLSIIYVYLIIPRYAYVGFPLSVSPICFLISIIVALLVSFVVAGLIENDGIKDTILSLIILMYFFPQFVLFAFAFNDILHFIYVFLYLIGMLFANRFIPISSKKFQVEGRANLFEFIIVSLGIIMVFLSGLYTRFRISFDFSDYYEYRFEVRELAMPAVFRYLLAWARIFMPIGLIYALIKKKKWLVIFVSIAQVLCFSFNGKKSSLFMFLLAFAIAFFFRTKYRKNLPVLVTVLSGAAIVESVIRAGQSFICKHFLRRLMFIPAYLGWAYFDYFSDHQLDYLRSSILRWFGAHSPYSERIPMLIGRLYYRTASAVDVNANTGLCGDAFSNFGWFSLLFYPIMDVLVFKIIGKYTEGLDERLQIIICITVAYAFISGSFFTVLLTNGALLLILLMILLPKEGLLTPTGQGR